MINLDENLDDADAPKKTWDFPDIDNVDDLRLMIEFTLGMTVAEFKKLPVYKHAIRRGNPPWLKEL